MPNELQGAEPPDSLLRVAVRIRPRLDWQGEKFLAEVVKRTDDCTVGCLPAEAETPRSPSSGSNGAKAFAFDRVFDSLSTQDELYHGVAVEAVSNFLKGHSSTIFAYGQTGTGKSYTMGEVPMGEDTASITDASGIMFRAFEDIIQHRDAFNAKHAGRYSLKVKLSYLEIYMENIRDLLSTSDKSLNLNLRELPDAVTVVGAELVEVADLTALTATVVKGQRMRAQSSTKMNEHSSRSHAIVQLFMEQWDRDTKMNAYQMNFVDLAGSERVKRTGAAGDRLKEAQSINTSLSALGMVVNALHSGKSHIPYRDSKLTRLLKSSFTGSSKTLLIATVAPCANNVDESLSTLRFAHRLKDLKAPDVGQVMANELELAILRKEREELNADLCIVEKVYGYERQVEKRALSASDPSFQADIDAILHMLLQEEAKKEEEKRKTASLIVNAAVKSAVEEEREKHASAVAALKDTHQASMATVQQELESKKSNSQSKLKALQGENAILKEKNAKLNVKIVAIYGEKEKISKELASTTALLKQTEQQSKGWEEQFHSLSKEMADSGMTKKEKELEKEPEKEQSNATMTSEVAALTQVVSDLKHQHEEDAKEWHEQEKHLSLSLAQQQDACHELEATVLALREEVSRLKASASAVVEAETIPSGPREQDVDGNSHEAQVPEYSSMTAFATEFPRYAWVVMQDFQKESDEELSVETSTIVISNIRHDLEPGNGWGVVSLLENPTALGWVPVGFLSYLGEEESAARIAAWQQQVMPGDAKSVESEDGEESIAVGGEGENSGEAGANLEIQAEIGKPKRQSRRRSVRRSRVMTGETEINLMRHLEEKVLHYLSNDGSWLTKYAKNGKPHERFFFLRNNYTEIAWKETETGNKYKSVALSAIKRWMLGRSTDIFLKHRLMRDDDLYLSFSLEYVEGSSTKTLDVCAPTYSELNAWMMALIRLLPSSIRPQWRVPLEVDSATAAACKLSAAELAACQTHHMEPSWFVNLRDQITSECEARGYLIVNELTTLCDADMLRVSATCDLLKADGYLVHDM
jgi:hypothetical protein